MDLALHGETTGPRRLQLLGEFGLLHGAEPVALGQGGRRLLAFLALRDKPVLRSQVAGTLWWRSDAARASSNLRAALARLPRPGGSALVQGGTTHLHLADDVRVDLTGARHWIDDVQHGPPTTVDGCPDDLCEDLLPSWDEEWVVVEREQHRQLRLHALEELSAVLREAGRYSEALTAALAAVAGEPLRESAQRRVVEIHLAEGNATEALRQYEQYRLLLRGELGLAPSAAIRGLVRYLLGRPADPS